MKELTLREINRFDYQKTRKFVDKELAYLSHLGTKLTCLLPPNAGRQLSFTDKVSLSFSNSSKQEKYVEKKDYIEYQIKTEIDKIKDSLLKMSKDELFIFEKIYIYQNTETDIMDETSWSQSKLIRIKKSFIIKFALSKGIDFEK